MMILLKGLESIKNLMRYLPVYYEPINLHFSLSGNLVYFHFTFSSFIYYFRYSLFANLLYNWLSEKSSYVQFKIGISG